MRRRFVQVSGFVLAGGISRVEFCSYQLGLARAEGAEYNLTSQTSWEVRNEPHAREKADVATAGGQGPL